MSKIPFFKFFTKSKFSVSDVNKYFVQVNPQPTLNCVGRIWKRSIKDSPCHPELVLGSSRLQECLTICTQKSNVGLKAQPTSTAFTLAEVLITLGIIGVVAAMTLPTIISKYKRQVVEVKLQKFYSIMNQAVTMSLAEHNDIPIENQYGENSVNGEYIENWYKTYITKYIKLIKEEGAEAHNAYYHVVFLDGSGFNSYMSSASNNSNSNLYIFFCLNYSKCKRGRYDGYNSFLFIYGSKKHAVEPIFSGSSISNLKNSCYDSNNRQGCAALIMKNGWKIPDDYPWL